MNLNIYDKDLNRVDIIENRFVSCFWAEGYNTTEKFTLELQESDAHKKNIRPGYFVGRPDREALMVITTVEAKDGKIVATGKEAKRILDDVVFFGNIPAGQNVDKAITNAYNNSSKCVDVDFAESDIGAIYDEEMENASILKIAETMCSGGDVGFKIVKNGKRLLVKFYKPTDENPYKMSKGFGNVDIKSILLSIENLKNYAIVIGQDSSGNIIRVDVDETNGEPRKEVIVSNPNGKKNAESLDSFKKRLRSFGHEQLEGFRKTWRANIGPSAADFGSKYDLGDFVVLFLPDYDLRFMARVTRFEQIEQNNSSKLTISVGEITIIRSKK
jgi:hypothetical protein